MEGFPSFSIHFQGVLHSSWPDSVIIKALVKAMKVSSPPKLDDSFHKELNRCVAPIVVAISVLKFQLYAIALSVCGTRLVKKTLFDIILLQVRGMYLKLIIPDGMCKRYLIRH